MPEIRDLLAPLVDSPSRPPRPVEELAARARRRRRRRGTALASLATLLMVPAAVTLLRDRPDSAVLVSTDPTPSPEPPGPPPAPWSGPALARSEAPEFVEAWQADPYARAKCPLLAPADLGEGRGAAARATDRGRPGAWWVEFDLPGAPGEVRIQSPAARAGRATFFVSAVIGEPGYEVPRQPSDVARWPNTVAWADGSSAGWGVAGDGRDAPTQPDGSPTLWIAYLSVQGSPCQYQVGSYLGADHLVQLIGSLRRVATA